MLTNWKKKAIKNHLKNNPNPNILDIANHLRKRSLIFPEWKEILKHQDTPLTKEDAYTQYKTKYPHTQILPNDIMFTRFYQLTNTDLDKIANDIKNEYYQWENYIYNQNDKDPQLNPKLEKKLPESILAGKRQRKILKPKHPKILNKRLSLLKNRIYELKNKLKK